jgi:glycosyltransferase involved in cell wall biosynthesis
MFIVSPIVSIVIPVYNGANYMREAIDSALLQTYKNIEILVINDGSNDGGATEKIALSYGDQIRYFTKPNGGAASALNLAIKNMKGEYFSWLSHDDVYYPDKIESQINKLYSVQNFDTIIYCGYDVIDSYSKFLYSVSPDSVLPADKCNISLLPLLRGLIHGCVLLIPVKYFREIDIFDETLLATQDYALWFKFLRIAPICFDRKITVKSRVHAEQSTNRITTVLDECNKLWSSFLTALNEEEMIQMEGSPYLFLSRTALFLSTTPYDRACDLAHAMANKLLLSIKISIIMPVYNRIKFAIEAIESVIAQTHQNFELIVINDGSTEDLTHLIEECNKDSRIIYLSQKNKGVAFTRNVGIKKATGKYIAFLDADDLFYLNKLEMQLKFMEDNNLLFSHTSYQRINLDGKELDCVNSGSVLNGQVFPQIVSCCPIAAPTVMGASTLLKTHLFPENIAIGEDVCVWISIASKNLIGGIDIVLSKIRVSPNSAYADPKKLSVGLINIAAFVVNQPSLVQFSPLCKNLLSSAIVNLELLEAPTIPHTDYNPSYSTTTLITTTINTLKQHGLRITLCKIYYKIRKVTILVTHSLKHSGLRMTLRKIYYRLKNVI